MAYYEGETLKNRIARGPRPIEEALSLAGQIADGLAKAHERGIVHRDVKPANLILTTDGVVKIIDFGLAMLTEATRMTRPGTAMGTPAYMSREQARGDEIDARTDVWSLASSSTRCSRVRLRSGEETRARSSTRFCTMLLVPPGS